MAAQLAELQKSGPERLAAYLRNVRLEALQPVLAASSMEVNHE